MNPDRAAVIGIEEHWTAPELTAALKRLPEAIERFLTEFESDEQRDKFSAGNAGRLFGIQL
jgi:hypothetical protein